MPDTKRKNGDKSRDRVFKLDGEIYEYNIDKNRQNIKKHGISFQTAARVFLDYNRIEMFDDRNSIDEDRYNTIGDVTTGENAFSEAIVFVVYTERIRRVEDGRTMYVTRIISARYATGLERGLYYGKYKR